MTTDNRPLNCGNEVSRTATLCPAHSAIWVAGTPALSQVDTAA
ncbi:MAG: hypothetical protein ACRDQ4_25070 [Pseudonocardiaceae bacterium]